ncbi:MAG: hypothetical protein LBO79_11330 [Zoogloeaceae bacterium]|jgi:hypothetical protein|nr:hypothetical protein [Zoogloeaceae bacterium]
MPLNPLVSSLISSIISAILEAPSAPPPQTPQSMGVPYGLTRMFPGNAVSGSLDSAPRLGKVSISGKTFPAAPGLQIRNEFNRIVLPSMLSGSNFPVLYQMDATGANVWRIWILTPSEISALKISMPSPLPMPLY